MFRCKQQCISTLETHQKNLPFGMILFAFKFEKKSLYHQGFFAVKRRAVFILGAKPRGVRTAKCEAFHFAPRLFFRFLSLIPFTIRQQCIIIAPSNFPLNRFYLYE